MLQKLLSKHESEGSGYRMGLIFPEYTSKYARDLSRPEHTSGDTPETSLADKAGELVFGDGLEWGCCHSMESTERVWSCAVEIVVQALSIDQSLSAKQRVGKCARKTRSKASSDDESDSCGSISEEDDDYDV